MCCMCVTVWEELSSIFAGWHIAGWDNSDLGWEGGVFAEWCHQAFLCVCVRGRGRGFTILLGVDQVLCGLL